MNNIFNGGESPRHQNPQYIPPVRIHPSIGAVTFNTFQCVFNQLRNSASSFHWLSSSIFTVWSFVCSSRIRYTSFHLHYMMFQTIQTIYFLWGYDPGNMSVSFIHCLVLKSAFPWDKYWNSFPCQEVRWKFLNVVHQFYVSWGIAGKSSISEVSRKVTSLKTLHPDMPNCQIVSWNISTRYVREGEKKREGQYTEKCIQCQQMVVSSLCLITQTTCGAV